MSEEELRQLEWLASKGRWDAAQQLFASLSLSEDGPSPAAVDKLGLAVFAEDVSRTRAAVEKLRSPDASADTTSGP